VAAGNITKRMVKICVIASLLGAKEDAERQGVSDDTDHRAEE